MAILANADGKIMYQLGDIQDDLRPYDTRLGADGNAWKVIAAAEGSLTICGTTFDGKTYKTETACKTETENISVPGTATGEETSSQPDTPSQPDQPSESGKCKWCGKTHRGFWQSIVGFWHKIFSFFAHLFGRK